MIAVLDRETEIRDIINTFAFMPGWLIQPAKMCNDTELAVNIKALVPDLEKPWMHGERQEHLHIDLGLSDDAVIDAVKAGIKSVFDHEIDEWLTVGGVRVSEPEHGPDVHGCSRYTDGNSYRIGRGCFTDGE